VSAVRSFSTSSEFSLLGQVTRVGVGLILESDHALFWGVPRVRGVSREGALWERLLKGMTVPGSVHHSVRAEVVEPHRLPPSVDRVDSGRSGFRVRELFSSIGEGLENTDTPEVSSLSSIYSVHSVQIIIKPTARRGSGWTG